MKKFFVYLLLVFFINLFIPLNVFAKTVIKYKDVKNTDFQIVKKVDNHEKSYGLIDKNTKREILPNIYMRIKVLKLGEKIIFTANAGEYFTLYSPDGLFKNYLEQYYKSNNYLQKIKFENYPAQGIIQYQKKVDKNKYKYGLIVQNGDKIDVYKPNYNFKPFPDSNSIVSRMLNVTYLPISYYKWFIQGNDYIYTPVRINEEVNIDPNGTLTVKYKDISIDDKYFVINKWESYYLKDLKIKDLKNSKKYVNIKAPDKRAIEKFVKNAKSMEEIYIYLNASTNFEFINYPKNALIHLNNGLYLFENGKKYLYWDDKKFNNWRFSDMSNDYRDSFKLDRNLLINEITGLEISFQDSDNLIVKNLQTKKWGIIDKNENIKVPFEYDEIYAQGNNITEIISNIEDINAKKLYIRYEGKSNDYKLFLAKKGEYCGVINDKNEIIVPFENVNLMEEEGYKVFQKALENQLKQDKKSIKYGKVKRFFRRLPLNTFAIIMLPLAMVFPPLGFALFMGLEDMM